MLMPDLTQRRLQQRDNPKMTTTVDFIIPTLKRPDHLNRCLSALAGQAILPSQVYVGIRADDPKSHDVLDRFKDDLAITAVVAVGVGVVGSMNSCLRYCQSEFIAFMDDDVELPGHWLEIMIDHLRSTPVAVAASGRDLLMDYPEMRSNETLVDDVGTFHGYGRITGNHHRGGGQPRLVDILRGSNCLFRGDFLRSAGFEKGLAGRGAQVNWELALALQARRAGYRMLFDPTVQVIHHVAPRHDNDSLHRGDFDYQSTSDVAHNETLVAIKHGKGVIRLSIPIWQLLIGSQICPGILRAFEPLFRPTPKFGARFHATISGRLAAIRTYILRRQHAG
ncbi:glycosyltransferase family 2 protein [Rhodopirellula sp. SWK7]|uniref:glycosyltransferase family 2 protein n=1 Tax=Rhodopirellula sp. SWK7 TaxID=595460 RepID=UPI0002BDFF0C|nr:glycosyltransferase [Rhodopirellula sp. SWK7]EMI42504.1 glycosyl transferase, group 2 family protein [Rhodopirellula sp. SWK7]